MSKPILVGYDPRGQDHAPVLFGVAMGRVTGAPVIVAAVQGGDPPVMPISAGQTLPYGVVTREEDLLDDCTQELEHLESEIRAPGVRVECRRLTSSSAARALHDEAHRIEAGMLVVGSSRHGKVGRVLLGSTADRLMHGAPCPVAVVPNGWTDRGELRTVAVGFVDTKEGHEALRAASQLAQLRGATLRVVTAVRVGVNVYGEAETPVEARPDGDLEGDYLRRVEQHVREALGRLPGDVGIEVTTLVGDAADALIRVSQDVDLLVIGSRGYGPLRAVAVGGVSRRVADEAHCPVIVLPRGVEASLDALLADAPGAAAAT